MDKNSGVGLVIIDFGSTHSSSGSALWLSVTLQTTKPMVGSTVFMNKVRVSQSWAWAPRNTLIKELKHADFLRLDDKFFLRMRALSATDLDFETQI